MGAYKGTGSVSSNTIQNKITEENYTIKSVEIAQGQIKNWIQMKKNSLGVK